MSLKISRPDRLTHEASRAWGLSTAVDAYGCDPSAIRSREHIVRFTHELCDLLGVKRFGETQVVRFGDDPRIHGCSMVQLIETSLVSGHFAEESNAAYVDIFSCKWYDSAAAARFAREFFHAGSVQVHTIPDCVSEAIRQAIFQSRGVRLWPDADAGARGIGPAYVDSLDMADRLDGNLAHVRRWAADDPQADDWSRFTEYVLSCEGVAAPTREDVWLREQHTRRVIANVLRTNARDRYPLGPERVGTYDLLISGFCLDCLSQSKAIWRRCMRNVFGLLEPGGSFVLLALRGCEGYRVGDQWFPGANIQLGDWEAELLSCHADAAHLEVAEHELPSHAGQGYTGILLACGRTSV